MRGSNFRMTSMETHLMKTHHRSEGPARLRLLCLAVLPVIALVLAVPYFQGAQAANGDSVAVSYSHGAMHVTIPYQSLHPGEGQLEVEVLDPEDQIVGHSEQRAAASEGKGWWQADLKLTKTVAIEDLVWHRLRYAFTYSDQKDAAVHGTESISQILRMPVIHILGQQSYLSGGPAAGRVVVTDSKNEVIAGVSSLRVELSPPNSKPRVLFTS